MATGKRAAGRENPNGRRWEDLSPELLVTIFQRLGVADLIAGVPFVCSSWRAATLDPLCWLELDFREWIRIFQQIGVSPSCDLRSVFSHILRFAVARSRHLLKCIYFPSFVFDEDLFNVATSCPRLEYFDFPNGDSAMEAELFCNSITRLKFLRGMKVNERFIEFDVLQHVNQCCVHLTDLGVFSHGMDARMASIICESLPSIRKLEITDPAISSQAIIVFLDGLKELEHFDISGYKNSPITDVILKKASRLKIFIWNSGIELGEFIDCSFCGSNIVSEESCRTSKSTFQSVEHVSCWQCKSLFEFHELVDLPEKHCSAQKSCKCLDLLDCREHYSPHKPCMCMLKEKVMEWLTGDKDPS
ncbi:F-box/LRR-repeat protein At3g48880-like [Curcuma longa]|uniref:F-box/LRR-repeat protein At3g48880-like n=1 Tax=Curcuma longa TaxID=136217 RepID=UPI003D9E94A7